MEGPPCATAEMRLRGSFSDSLHNTSAVAAADATVVIPSSSHFLPSSVSSGHLRYSLNLLKYALFAVLFAGSFVSAQNFSHLLFGSIESSPSDGPFHPSMFSDLVSNFRIKVSYSETPSTFFSLEISYVM